MNFQPLMIFSFWEKSFSLGLELDVKSEEFRKCVVNLSFKFSPIAKVFFPVESNFNEMGWENCVFNAPADEFLSSIT